MKNIDLVKPKLNQYAYYKKIISDKKTMSYDIGYSLDNKNYHYDTGCIDFNIEKWKCFLKNQNNYLAYIRDFNINKYIGYVSYYYNNIKNFYECDIVIEYKYRNKGYSKDALKLLVRTAYENGIDYLYNSFEKDRNNTLKIFLDVGFSIYQETIWTKLNRNVEGVIVRIKTSNILPKYSNLKTIEDILLFMKDNIRYGWLDINNNIHIGNMKEFRKLYRTLTIEEILKYQVGTCIDQVNLMHFLLNNINIKNKMFATRIYEDNDYNNLEEEEHMHCFILCYIDDKVYHIEHPNFYKIGIYEYKDEKDALSKINKYYINLSGGISRPITEFYKVEDNISFKEFNNYLNNLNISFRKLKNNKNDYELLYNWCKQEYIYKYFEQRKLSYKEIENKYKKKLK